MKLIIGNKNYSSWSLRPWLLLRAFGLTFEEVRIPLYQADSTERLLQHSGAGKVPVLEDGGLTIWDSLAICEYVSERYLDGRGWPADAHKRALARAASAEMHAGFSTLRTRLPMNCRALGRKVAVDGTLAAEIERIDQLWQQLRGEFGGEGDWLFGEFSIADCMYAPVVSRFQTYGVDVSPVSRRYMEVQLADEYLRDWYRAAEMESELIAESEVGVAAQ